MENFNPTLFTKIKNQAEKDSKIAILLNELITEVNNLIDGVIDTTTVNATDVNATGTVTTVDADISGTATVDTINESTTAAGVTVDSTLIKDGGVKLGTSGVLDLSATGASTKISSTITRHTAVVSLTATEIVGTDAGDLGSVGGATLVAAPGEGFAIRVVDVIWNYTFDTAAYTGGGNDLVVQSGTTGTAWTAAVSSAALLGAAANAYYNSPAIAASLDTNEAIVAASTAWTNPGTAAGTLDITITYDVITL